MNSLSVPALPATVSVELNTAPIVIPPIVYEAETPELSSSDKHRDIETILLDLQNKKINVSRATLYRTIDVFVKHSLLKKITLDSGKFLYEHNKKTITPKHDHIVCEDCGEIFEFYDNSISNIEKKIADDLNLKVTKRVHQLSGSCKDDKCSHAKN